MDRIYAGSNIRIEIQPDRWVLLLHSESGDTVLAEAVENQPMRYISTFGSQRRLPISGQLALHEIERVVLGWSAKDESWHLGLMLAPALAQARSSRWCELASWPDPTGDQFDQAATQAGKTLSRQLQRPFTLIPPRQDEMQAVRQAPPPILPPLPIRLDLWTLKHVARDRDNGSGADSLEFRLSSAWGRGKVLRAGWYIIWTGVFIILSGKSLIGAIALPRPEFLPYLGLACAVLLTLIAFSNLIRASRRLNRIVIDPLTRAISGGRGRRVGSGRGERWRYSADQIQAIYASQVVSKINRRRGRDPLRTVNYGELNLLLNSGKFVHLIAHGALDDKIPALDPLPDENERRDPANNDQITPLTAYEAQTPLQAAALYVASALGKPAYTDRRVR
jgi:hypothetical protein